MKNEYTPDDVSSPGETILEIMQQREMTIAELADEMGVRENTVRHIIRGHLAISEVYAYCLTKVLGGTVEFWKAREKAYRKYLLRLAMQKQKNDPRAVREKRRYRTGEY